MSENNVSMPDWMDVAGELQPYLWRGELDYCINRVSDILQGLPATPFHHVLTVRFTNDPAEVASHFDQFLREEHDEHRFAALYTETNGFYINPDRWYFDIFGYSVYGGPKEDLTPYDWLARYDAHYPHEITLTGMEDLQRVYQEVDDSGIYDSLNYGSNPAAKQLEQAKEFCDLLVVLRFQELIGRSAAFMQQVDVPVLATSHDYDFILEVNPGQMRGSKSS